MLSYVLLLRLQLLEEIADELGIKRVVSLALPAA